MKENRLYSQLKNGEIVLGVGNMYPCAGILEGMAKGWDWAWIDSQHGQYSYHTCLEAVRAAHVAGVSSVIRVPGHEYGILGPIADLDPDGIMCPMVDNVEQARTCVRGLRFPPLGNRSYGGRRVVDLHGRDYYAERRQLLIAQVETLESVQNAEAIINTDGVDVLFFGPDDMKVRMGIPINTPVVENDQLRKALEVTAKAAHKAGKFAGTVAPNKEQLKLVTDLGYQLVVGGGDILFLRTTAAAKLAELREAAGAAVKKVDPKEAKAVGVYGA